MRIRYALVPLLAALLTAACGSPTAEPTLVVSAATATPAAAPTLAATTVVSPTGGVELALAAIEPVAGVLATVNSQEITWADYEPELIQALHGVTQQYAVDWNQAENIAMLGEFQDQVLSTLISRIVLRQGSASAGIRATEEAIAARIDEEKAEIISSGEYASWEAFLEDRGLSDAYFARLMEDNLLVEQLTEVHAPSREAEQVHARHILVTDEASATAVFTRLDAGEDWAVLARELSLDTANKDAGGDLGWFPRGVMVPAFEEVAFSLEPGTISDVVATDFGYHIIQVLEKATRDMDDAIYERVTTKAFEFWFEGQKAIAAVDIAVTFAP
ncbi:MAG: peptidylprolyl isomerase [Anaerolineae bacterium]|nr:peptidylprolyl isomerase [Anaerolineae bacterium]